MAENRLFGKEYCVSQLTELLLAIATDDSSSSFESAPSELLPPQLQADYLYPPAQAGYHPPAPAVYQPVSSYQPVQADFNKKTTEHQPDLGNHN